MNKVKAEQEGWGATDCDDTSDALLRPQSHSPPNHSLRTSSSTFRDLRCSTNELVPLPSASVGQSTRTDRTSRNSSHQIDPGSPRLLTDHPLVLSSVTSLSSALPHLRMTPVSANDSDPTHASSKALSPSTDFDLISSNCRSLSTTSTTWTTGLPTILSIASSLKDVYADRRTLDHVNPEHNHLIHPSDLSLSLHAPNSPHSTHASGHQSLFSLDTRNGTNGEMPPSEDSPSILLRYTIPDTTTVDPTSPVGSGTSYGTNTDGTVAVATTASTVNDNSGRNSHSKSHTSPLSVCPPLQNTNFARDDIYTSSDSSSLTSSIGLLPSILSTGTANAHSPLGLSSAGKPQAVAFVFTSNGAVTTTAVPASINQGRIVRSSDGKQSYARLTPGSTVSSVTTDQILSRVASTTSGSSALGSMGILQDSTTGTLLINSGSQLHQLSALYPGLNGALDMVGSDELQQNFVFHPNLNGDNGVPLTFGTHLNTGLSEPSSFLGSPQMSTGTTNGNKNPDDCTTTDLLRSETTNGSVLCSGVPFSRMGPIVGSSQNTASDSVSNIVVSDTTGSHLTPFNNPQSNTTGSSKKTKRSGRKARSCRNSNDAQPSVNQSGMVSSINDSSAGPNAYVTPAQFSSDVVSKSGSKRGRESSDASDPLNPVLFHTVQSIRDPGSYQCPPMSSGQLVYMTDTDRTVLVKQEAPVHGTDIMDDGSTHSDSISADTGGGTQGQSGCAVTNASGQTPPSSVDDLDQHHLKLERKRARNRVAARRCRERKITLIRALENQVAERDAHVRCLEDLLARYRSEGERLRKHMEILANSYPSLKAELYQYPVLFQQQQQQQTQLQQHNTTAASEQQPSGLTQPNVTQIPERVSTKHFS
ncbi:unnamed protein product [Echinostoma caproni]|uniref:BZIP domain-containing protein n=1 Tax=Echinostoma caproni TaxID=27848 RepID=A0A3P8JWG5_9TREM|nr:unnamed protein product [Echinostoma caproni]